MSGAFEQPWKHITSALSLVLVLSGCQPEAPKLAAEIPDHSVEHIMSELPADKIGYRSPDEGVKVFVAIHGFGTRLSALGTSVTPKGTVLPYFIDKDWDDSVEEKLIPRKGLFDIQFDPSIKAELQSDGYQIVRDLMSGHIEIRLPYESTLGKFEITRTIRSDRNRLEIESIVDGPPGGTFELKHVVAGEPVDGVTGSSQVDGHRVQWNHSQGENRSRLDIRFVRDDYPQIVWATPRITIDGPLEDQRAINAMLLSFDEGLRGIPAPMGLSSDLYFGHIFWDADIWMYPVAALLMPDKARSMVSYRVERLPQAEKNFTEWLESGRPRGSGGPMGKPEGKVLKGIKFPWESARTGKETVPGPSRFQDHITGSVFFGLHQARMLDQLGDKWFDQMVKLGAEFYRLRSEKGSDGLMNLRGTMSPDEHHTGDNDLYTNLLAERVTRWSGNDELKWVRPRDAKSLLNYEADRGKGYKQAAGVLAVYPLQDPEAEAQAMVMLRRFAPGVIKSGPAMTDSVHAIIEARFGDPDKALTTWRKSWGEFMDLPMGMFSEKRRGDRSYFLTGAGGCLQTVLFGFAGIRLDEKNVEGGMKLASGKGTLSIRPRLPKEWRSMTIEPIFLPIEGKHEVFTLRIEGDQVDLKPITRSLLR